MSQRGAAGQPKAGGERVTYGLGCGRCCPAQSLEARPEQHTSSRFPGRSSRPGVPGLEECSQMRERAPPAGGAPPCTPCGGNKVLHPRRGGPSRTSPGGAPAQPAAAVGPPSFGPVSRFSPTGELSLLCIYEPVICEALRVREVPVGTSPAPTEPQEGPQVTPRGGDGCLKWAETVGGERSTRAPAACSQDSLAS